jgi:exopolysaccharide biosynthesis polyprenyl glycosylphosphotransferase
MSKVNTLVVSSECPADPPPPPYEPPALVDRFLARRIVILGSGPMAAKLIEEINASDAPRCIVVGIVDDEPPQALWAKHTRWLGPPDRLGEIVKEIQPSLIVVACADRRQRLPLQLLLESRVHGVMVEDAVEFYEELTGKIAIEALNPSTLILSKGFRNHGAAEVVARIVSVVGATIGLIVTAPLLALIALAVKLDSRGPVLFVQDRAGRSGRSFKLLKFRTMHPSSETHTEWVRDNEHRITRLGRWLRRFRFDELPQLVNVVLGEMNLVGPRPHPIGNHEIFLQRIAYYPLRSTVRPGVTGWAQVRYGYANNLEEETEKMRYDLYYIKNRSVWLDAWILLRTVLIMLFGQGATEVRRRTPAKGRAWSTPRRGAPAKEAGYAPVLVRSGGSRPSPGQP